MPVNVSPLNAQILRDFQKGNSQSATVLLRFLNQLLLRTGGATDQVASTQTQVSQQAGLIQETAANANQAQSDADAAAGGTPRSGSANNPSVNLSGTAWQTGPQVDLLTVSAGNLTIPGSGPVYDADVGLPAPYGASFGEYRIVEIVGMVETTIHTGTFSAIPSGVGLPDSGGVEINTDGSTFGVSYARSSTGSVSYRLDARRTSGNTLNNLYLYLYARRS